MGVSVFDFPDYLYTDLRSGVVPSEFESLRAVYRQFLLPQSADFIHSCSSASIVFAMARHLWRATTCYVNMLVEHFLAGSVRPITDRFVGHMFRHVIRVESVHR